MVYKYILNKSMKKEIIINKTNVPGIASKGTIARNKYFEYFRKNGRK